MGSIPAEGTNTKLRTLVVPFLLVASEDCLGDSLSEIEAVLRWIMNLRNNPSKTGTERVTFDSC